MECSNAEPLSHYGPSIGHGLYLIDRCGSPDYIDYVFGGFIVLAGLFISLIVIIIICYTLPIHLGHWFIVNRRIEWLNRREVDMWPINWNKLGAGYLLMVIIVTAVVSSVTALYWLGHLII